MRILSLGGRPTGKPEPLTSDTPDLGDPRGSSGGVVERDMTGGRDQRPAVPRPLGRRPAHTGGPRLLRRRDGAFLLADGLDRGAPLPRLETPIEADLCIVGGGFTGLWAALHAKADAPGREVVVLEAEAPGGAASGRNGGFSWRR
jgi:FAD dependent oxidoreductase